MRSDQTFIPARQTRRTPLGLACGRGLRRRLLRTGLGFLTFFFGIIGAVDFGYRPQAGRRLVRQGTGLPARLSCLLPSLLAAGQQEQHTPDRKKSHHPTPSTLLLTVSLHGFSFHRGD